MLSDSTHLSLIRNIKLLASTNFWPFKDVIIRQFLCAAPLNISPVPERRLEPAQRWVTLRWLDRRPHQPPPRLCHSPSPLGPDSNYSATCQLKNNRSRICHLTGWWRYFCLVIFQIPAGFHLFNSLAVAFVPGWHFLRKKLSHCVCTFYLGPV